MVMQKGEVNGSIRKRESEIGPSSSFSPNSLRLPRKDYLNEIMRIRLFSSLLQDRIKSESATETLPRALAFSI